MNNKPLIIGLLLIVALVTACTVSDGSSALPVPTPAVEPAPADLALDPAETASPTAHLQHNGITLSYDPALLGRAVIQDVPASANQGLFEQPGPAHTRVGFAPAGTPGDSAYQWALTWEPTITIYNLNDFGSFADGDQYARRQVALLGELLENRPSTITQTIPVIPPINSGQIIRTQVKWLDFGSGTGVRFLTQYDQAPSPINNEGLVYIFQGMTNDGRHGVTALFPLDAPFLPDGPAMDEAAYTVFIENFDAEMTAAAERLNAAPEGDFNPRLSQLDALIEAIAVSPTEADFPLAGGEPQYGRVLVASDILSAPGGSEAIGSLQAGDMVIINATSQDGRHRRILCQDGSTGSCWVAAEALAVTTVEAGPVFYTGGMPQEGAVVGITAVSDNPVYNGPGESYQLIGRLLSGESLSVFGPDETNQWLAAACPRNIGLACWVTADTAINEPNAFVSGESWQEIAGDWVTFRLPGTWQPAAVIPGMGSILAEWRLGIPEAGSDQSIAFFTMPLEQPAPDDVVAEYELLIGDEPGVKWVRRGEGYVSYDYYSPGTAATRAAGAGSFGLQVTVPAEDPELEAMLDMVAASIRFTR